MSLALASLARKRRDLRHATTYFEDLQGPETAAELGNWVNSLLKVMTVRGLRDRAICMLQNGLVGTTDFSGVDFPVESIRLSSGALMSGSPKVVFVRSCDWERVPQRILRESAKPNGCVFHDVNERLHPDMKAWIDENTPRKETSKTRQRP